MKKFIRKVLLLLFIGLFIFSIWQIASYAFERVSAIKDYEEIKEIVESFDEGKEKKIDYAGLIRELKQKNEDVVAFLKVDGTYINYPVVQAKDNDFYLRRNLNKEKNLVGIPFMDCRNSSDLTDKNTVIYGHMINMVKKDMFAPILDFLEQDYADKSSKKIDLITERGIYHYRIFSILQLGETVDYRSNNPEEDKFLNFLNVLVDKSITDMALNKEFNRDSKILTLSTCTPEHDSRQRIALFAIFEGVEK